jgi:hypothetical protein
MPEPTENKKEEFIDHEGIKYKVEESINDCNLALYDSHTVRNPHEPVTDNTAVETVSEFAGKMLEYAKVYARWHKVPHTKLRTYMKDMPISTKREVAVDAKIYFYDYTQRLFRSLKDYGVNISKYDYPGYAHNEMYRKSILATNILDSLLKDYLEDKIEEFLFMLVPIADEIFSYCKEIKDEYLSGAMSMLAGLNNNRTEGAVPVQG